MYNFFYETREVKLAKFILTRKCTIRQTAKIFNLSKSTVHNDVSNKLKKSNYALYTQVQKILQYNYEQKHIRGGLATKRKYAMLKRLNAY